MGVGEYPSGTLRFKKIDGSFWNGETFRFADYNRKARNAYYKAAYKKLYTDFTEGVSAVLKDMNALLSKEQLEENKRMANE